MALLGCCEPEADNEPLEDDSTAAETSLVSAVDLSLVFGGDGSLGSAMVFSSSWQGLSPLLLDSFLWLDSNWDDFEVCLVRRA